MSENNKPDRVDLGNYRWKNRLVLIFAPSDKDSSYSKQNSEFEGKSDELEDRDIVFFQLLKEGKSTMAEKPLKYEQQSSLREEFDVGGDFLFILIGKDGTVKLRSEEPVLSDDLFGLIDSMPMRKEEIRIKTNKSQNLD